ncbi:RNA polymerase sigma factor [Spirosoma validum]|uniref:RNA polymerase sigma factor n=1 Tax=Spirosoma validum TaxID=2771355 RepID=A0A927GEZ6_9BACT|nr:RNA polymerase sigma factor [Spirosoma validum]MBD2755319.1 RNA polymerase sigma factor [Spirosoma validum]
MGLFSRQPSDADLIAGIQTGGTQRRLYENKLYEKYQYLITDGTRKHRLTEDECASVYSDTMLTAFDNITKGQFEGRSSLKTYLYQIFTNKCVDAIRKKTTNRSSVHDAFSLDDSLMQLPDESRSIVQTLIAQSDFERLQLYLRELGEKCRAMILSWGEGYSDDEIAQAMGYNSAAVAKTSRLRCLEKLRERFS